MLFPCPQCRNAMVETRYDHGDHLHPRFVCICGADIILTNIDISKEET